MRWRLETGAVVAALMVVSPGYADMRWHGGPPMARAVMGAGGHPLGANIQIAPHGGHGWGGGGWHAPFAHGGGHGGGPVGNWIPAAGPAHGLTRFTPGGNWHGGGSVGHPYGGWNHGGGHFYGGHGGYGGGYGGGFSGLVGGWGGPGYSYKRDTSYRSFEREYGGPFGIAGYYGQNGTDFQRYRGWDGMSLSYQQAGAVGAYLFPDLGYGSGYYPNYGYGYGGSGRGYGPGYDYGYYRPPAYAVLNDPLAYPPPRPVCLVQLVIVSKTYGRRVRLVRRDHSYIRSQGYSCVR